MEDVRQIGRRDAYGADSGDNRPLPPEHSRIQTDKGGFTLPEQQHKEVEARRAVGQEGRQSCSGCAHVQSLGQDEDRVQDNVQQTAAHCADTGMEGRSLRADEKGQYHV